MSKAARLPLATGGNIKLNFTACGKHYDLSITYAAPAFSLRAVVIFSIQSELVRSPQLFRDWPAKRTRQYFVDDQLRSSMDLPLPVCKSGMEDLEFSGRIVREAVCPAGIHSGLHMVRDWRWYVGLSWRRSVWLIRHAKPLQYAAILQRFHSCLAKRRRKRSYADHLSYRARLVGLYAASSRRQSSGYTGVRCFVRCCRPKRPAEQCRRLRSGLDHTSERLCAQSSSGVARFDLGAKQRLRPDLKQSGLLPDPAGHRRSRGQFLQSLERQFRSDLP